MAKAKVAAVVIALLALLAGCGLSPQHNAPVESGAKLEGEFIGAIDVSNRCILVPVQYKGQEYLFVLDTGCSGIAVDERFRPTLGPLQRKGHITTEQGRYESSVFEPMDATLGTINLKDAGPIFFTDLTMLQAIWGRDVAGIIGVSVLRKHAVELNWDTRTVRLWSNGRRDPAWDVSVAFRYGSGDTPEIQVGLPGDIRTWMMLDTGCTEGGSLKSSILRRLPRGQLKELGDGGWMDMFAGVLPTKRYRSQITIGESAYCLEISDGDVSVLGMDFFLRQPMMIDFPNRRLYLGHQTITEPPPIAYDGSGLVFRCEQGYVVVDKVLPGSPAERMALRQGDVIKEVNGKSVESMQPWEVVKLLVHQPGRKLSLNLTLAPRGDGGRSGEEDRKAGSGKRK